MTRDPMNHLADEINRAYRDADRAARKAGKAVLRAHKQLGWRLNEWLANHCDLPPEAVPEFLKLAELAETAKAALPVSGAQATVVCGWCLHRRAELGRPPKHLSGPRDAPQVVHGTCDECSAALDRRLAKLRGVKPEGPHDATEEALEAFQAVEWSLACQKLRTAFHHAEEAHEAIRALPLENIGVREGVEEQRDSLAEVLVRLARLSSELVLMSQETDYDVSGEDFSTEWP